MKAGSLLPYVGSRNQTQVVKTGGKYFYPVSHSTSPWPCKANILVKKQMYQSIKFTFSMKEQYLEDNLCQKTSSFMYSINAPAYRIGLQKGNSTEELWGSEGL